MRYILGNNRKLDLRELQSSFPNNNDLSGLKNEIFYVLESGKTHLDVLANQF